ncbi:MAG: D-cysteine desulfhydrase family protein [Armatimonadota bacterium]|nr:D-cysteine desulfhydrase family protein [Armatimonadota bacterium]
MNLDHINRVKLAALPTSIDEAPHLAAELGLSRLLIKRDDNTGLAMGGNKARKLEYLMADAIAHNADVILTVGGSQSNHARMTAAAARKLGMDVILFLGGPPNVRELNGNLLLDVLFDADIRYDPKAKVPQLHAAMEREADDLRARGRIPYCIPVGGSTPLGALGYVAAVREMAGQLDTEDRSCLIFVAVGSGGTIAGLQLGIHLFLPDAEVIGVSVSRKKKALQKEAAGVANGSSDLISSGVHFKPDDFNIVDEYMGERYGVPSAAGNEAVLLAARTEGLVLDPIYTGKAMSGLIAMARAQLLDSSRTVIFIHTGGAPALFADSTLFAGLAKFSFV